MSPIHAERRARLLAAMAENGVDAMLICGNAWQNDYLRYATDFPPVEGDALALVLADGETRLFVEGPTEADRAGAACPEAAVVPADDIVDAARGALDALGDRRILAAPAGLMPYGITASDAANAPEDGTALLDRLLLVKSPAEIDAIRRASELADRGYQVFMDAAKVGTAEYEIVAAVEAFYRGEGCADNFMLIGAGTQELRGMHPAGERRVQAGDQVITELSPAVDGYYSQICRTLVVGAPSEAQRRAFDVYIEAAEAGLAVLRAGVTAGEVARAENDVFRKYGLGEYTTSEYTRVRGHGLGLFVDSRPHILEDVDTVLEAGSVVVVHPNTYHPDAGYMVLGDAAVVTDDGYRTFCTTPRTLLVAAG